MNHELRKIMVFLLLASCLLLLTSRAFAATPTPQPVSLNEKLNDALKDFKDRIASSVAQMKLVERRGIIGMVTDVSSTQIVITDLKQQTRFIDVDELTKFSSPTSRDFGISDIGKGTKLGVLGLYNKDSQRTLARFINVISNPHFFQGVITSVDNKNYSLSISLVDDKQMVTEVETSTKTFQYTKDRDLFKSGFSKIAIGQRVFIAGFTDLKDKNRIIALRIIVFPEIPKNPHITNLSVPTQEPTPTPIQSGPTNTPTPTVTKKTR